MLSLGSPSSRKNSGVRQGQAGCDRASRVRRFVRGPQAVIMPIAPTAIVHPSARIHPSTIVGDYAIVEGDVELGPNNRLDPFSIVKRYTTMGEGNHLYAGAQVGMDPLDKKFREEDRTYIRIGNFNVL